MSTGIINQESVNLLAKVRAAFCMLLVSHCLCMWRSFSANKRDPRTIAWERPNRAAPTPSTSAVQVRARALSLLFDIDQLTVISTLAVASADSDTLKTPSFGRSIRDSISSLSRATYAVVLSERFVCV